MADTTFINRVITIDTAKHLTVTTTHTITKHHQPQTFIDSNTSKVFFPLLVTILLFFAGQTLTVYFKKKERKNQLQNSKTNLETWILQLSTTAQSLVHNCNEFSEELEVQKEVQNVTLKYSPTLINKISELNVTDFLNYSTLNLKGENDDNAAKALDIIHEIELMKNVEVDIKKHYDKFSEKVEKLIDRWNSANRELENVKLTMFKEVANKQENLAYNFSHQANNFFNAWYVSENDFKNVEVWAADFISPFLDLLHQEIYKNPENIYPSLFIEKLKSISEIISNWQAIQKGYAALMKEYADTYWESYITLKEDITVLRTKQLLSTWYIK